MPFRFNDARNPRVAGPLPGQMQEEDQTTDPVDPVDPGAEPETPERPTGFGPNGQYTQAQWQAMSGGFQGGGAGYDDPRVAYGQTEGMGNMGGDPTGGSPYGASAPQQGVGSPGYTDPRVAYNPGQNFGAPGVVGGTYTGGSGSFKLGANGQFEPVPGGGAGGGAATTPPKPFAFNYLSGVTSANPMGGSNAVNPTQFATPGSAQDLAKQLGGQAYGLNLEGPGNGFSQAMQQIKFGNGREINAGLAGDLYGKYGSAPGTYGNYLVNRDVTGDYGPSAYDTKQNASGAAEMAQVQANQQQIAQQGQQQVGQFNQQLAAQKQSEQQQAIQALQGNGWSQNQDGAWVNGHTGETQYADPVVLLMREMPGLAAPSGSWQPPQGVPQAPQQGQQQPQQNYGGYGQQPQQQPQQYQAQPYPMPNQSATQVGAQSYQGMQSPQAYQNQFAQQGSFSQSQQPGYGQYGGQQQQQMAPAYQQRQQRYGSYGGQMGGNQRQPSQQPQQQPYTAGSSSAGYKSPYGGGYLSSGAPNQSKSGGYMQSGNNKF